MELTELPPHMIPMTNPRKTMAHEPSANLEGNVWDTRKVIKTVRGRTIPLATFESRKCQLI